MCSSSTSGNTECGQATIAMAVVVLIALGAAVVLSMVGEAMVHRARARTAADAVALASTGDNDASDQLAQWYTDRNVSVERVGSHAVARSGPSQAAAWASTGPSSTQPAPALVAIVARAEQLVGAALVPTRWESTTVVMRAADAAVLRAVAADLGLCERSTAADSDDQVAFELC